MGDLSITLNSIGFVQLALAFAFLIGYALAIGAMFGPTGRQRAAFAAFVAAGAFTAMTDPWVHGALLVVCAIAGVGLFITLVWALSLYFGATHTPGTAMVERADVAEFAEITAAAALVDAEGPALTSDPRLAVSPIATPQARRARSA